MAYAAGIAGRHALVHSLLILRESFQILDGHGVVLGHHPWGKQEKDEQYACLDNMGCHHVIVFLCDDAPRGLCVVGYAHVLYGLPAAKSAHVCPNPSQRASVLMTWGLDLPFGSNTFLPLR